MPPDDDPALYINNGAMLPFFPSVRNISACDPGDTEGDATCFFAEVGLCGTHELWERVVLKEAPPPSLGLSQVLLCSSLFV